MQFEAFGRTDAGPVRENNEDSLLLEQLLRILFQMLIRQTIDGRVDSFVLL